MEFVVIDNRDPTRTRPDPTLLPRLLQSPLVPFFFDSFKSFVLFFFNINIVLYFVFGQTITQREQMTFLLIIVHSNEHGDKISTNAGNLPCLITYSP